MGTKIYFRWRQSTKSFHVYEPEDKQCMIAFPIYIKKEAYAGSMLPIRIAISVMEVET